MFQALFNLEDIIPNKESHFAHGSHKLTKNNEQRDLETGISELSLVTGEIL